MASPSVGVDLGWDFTILPDPEKVEIGGEDSCSFASPSGDNNHCATFVVCDGVGGQEKKYHDEIAVFSRTFAQTAMEEAEEIGGSNTTLRELMENTQYATRLPGTTTVAAARVHLTTGELEVVNLGDSGVLVFRGRKLVRRTMSQQSQFNCPAQLGWARDQCGGVKPKTGFLLAPVGSIHEATEFRFQLKVGDIILLASDGVLDNMSIPEIESMLPKHPSEVEAATIRVTDRAREIAIKGSSKAVPWYLEAANFVARDRMDEQEALKTVSYATNGRQLLDEYRAGPHSSDPAEVKGRLVDLLQRCQGGKLDDATAMFVIVLPPPTKPAVYTSKSTREMAPKILQGDMRRRSQLLNQMAEGLKSWNDECNERSKQLRASERSTAKADKMVKVSQILLNSKKEEHAACVRKWQVEKEEEAALRAQNQQKQLEELERLAELRGEITRDAQHLGQQGDRQAQVQKDLEGRKVALDEETACQDRLHQQQLDDLSRRQRDLGDFQKDLNGRDKDLDGRRAAFDKEEYRQDRLHKERLDELARRHSRLDGFESDLERREHALSSRQAALDEEESRRDRLHREQLDEVGRRQRLLDDLKDDLDGREQELDRHQDELDEDVAACQRWHQEQLDDVSRQKRCLVDLADDLRCHEQDLDVREQRLLELQAEVEGRRAPQEGTAKVVEVEASEAPQEGPAQRVKDAARDIKLEAHQVLQEGPAQEAKVAAQQPEDADASGTMDQAGIVDVTTGGVAQHAAAGLPARAARANPVVLVSGKMARVAACFAGAVLQSVAHPMGAAVGIAAATDRMAGRLGVACTRLCTRSRPGPRIVARHGPVRDQQGRAVIRALPRDR